MTRTFSCAVLVAALLVSFGCQDTIETTDDPIVDTGLKDPELTWSKPSAEVTIEADNDFPELVNHLINQFLIAAERPAAGIRPKRWTKRWKWQSRAVGATAQRS